MATFTSSPEFLLSVLYLIVFCKALFNKEDGVSLPIACLIAMIFQFTLLFFMPYFEANQVEWGYYIITSIINSTLFGIVYSVLKHNHFQSKSTILVLPLMVISVFPFLMSVQSYINPYESASNILLDTAYTLTLLVCHGWLLINLDNIKGDKVDGTHNYKEDTPSTSSRTAIYDDSRSPLQRHVANTLASKGSIYHYKEYLESGCIPDKKGGN